MNNPNMLELSEINEEQKEKGERRKKGAGEAILQVAAGKKRGNHKPRWNVYPNIHFNVTEAEENYNKRFPSNRITTTKYNPFNFLPKFLFEQFRKVTNIFFLGIAIITFIPTISPVQPYTSIVPLAFILVVTAIREGYEDFNRLRADHKANNKKYMVLQTDGTKKECRSRDLLAGDIVYLEKNSTLPADVLLLKTALEESLCFVETAQLDGESNLKQLKAIKETNNMKEEDFCRLRGTVECEEPHPLFYTFHARLRINDNTYALDTKQLLLRGTFIRNTPWVYGVIVYAGSDSKLSLNQRNPPSKFSSMDRQMNKIVGGIFLFMFICCVVLAICGGVFQGQGAKWYLNYTTSPAVAGILIFFAYLVLLSFLIPQSLFVTLEIAKLLQARYMEWDQEMMTDKNDPETGMHAKTSSLNDELAIVKYIFSDKTGTLTQNKMVFDKASVGGYVYNNMLQGELHRVLQERSESSDQLEYISDFVRALAICHAVIAEEDDKGGIYYQAQSPDEAALVDGARLNGFVFRQSGIKGITTSELGEEQNYQVLANLEFTSDRARSSIIIKNKEGNIILYTKGSDAQILKRLSESSKKSKKGQEVYVSSLRHLDDFSNMGLRTLVVARRNLTKQQYEEWNKEYHAASTALQNRNEKVDKACELIECELEIIGCTAIEDKLQDGVPDTIEFLLQCGMKVWVITGDKQQTAINIGYSTKLIGRDQEKVIINVDKDAPSPGDSVKRQIREAVEKYTGLNPIVVVIDGESINHALKECSEDFVALTNLASAAVCCRVTPLQKAEVVRTIKEAKKEICLSIGDGANDVSMIQEAHIGIGIFGKEGTQAARASDYAIGQFSFLKRLLTVHGRYSYVRNLACIHQSFYKNMAFGFVQFWYAIFSGFSGQTPYDDFLLTAYNIVITSAPPFFTALFFKDVLEVTINQYPQLYNDLKTRSYFDFKTVGLWFLSALYHSWIVFMITWLVFRIEPQLTNGQVGDVYLFGQLAATMVVLVVLLKIALSIHYWTGVLIGFQIGSFAVYIILEVLISSFPAYWPKGYFEAYTIVQVPSFWFALLLGVVFCLLPDWSFKCIRMNYFPENWHILRERERLKAEGILSDDLESFTPQTVPSRRNSEAGMIATKSL